MLMPLMGFFLMLIILGGIGSLVAAFDPYAAKKASAPFAVAALFSGIGVYGLIFLAVFIDAYMSRGVADFIGIAGIPIGSIGGAIFGYRVGLRRRKKADDELQLREQEEASENL